MTGSRWLRLVAVGLAASATVSCSPSLDAAEHAVILLYHHVSASTPRSTSVTPERFEEHLDYLAANDFVVLPLEEIVHALGRGDELPPRAVALTFDDAYDSIFDEALPRLERRGWPFTVFVATDPVDHGYNGFMSWDELREIEARGGTIANHSSDHSHLVRHEPEESEDAWQERVRANIERAGMRLEQELERPLPFFAYPYGEFDKPLETIVAELGYVGFGQQSGPVGASDDRTRLPRYPVATGFDDLDSLAEKLRTRPLPVTVLAPDSNLLAGRSAAPLLRLRIPDGPYRRGDMRCYVAGQEPAQIEWQDDVAAIRALEPLRPGRTKYNCTAPSNSESDVFFWYSHLWIKQTDDGGWLAE
ncbi:MAG: polysaccharide deacetylase family protein [Gammaproteobacteria bacterium]